MNQNETHTYANNKQLNFWRSNKKWRSTNTGMNPNVISNNVPYTGKREYLDSHVDNRIFCTVKERNDRKVLIETVNGCLGDIYSCGVGYVFTDAQLNEVKSVLPRVRTSWNIESCCYSCRKL